MGAAKQLLPVDGAPMAVKVANELRAGGCAAVILVTRSELVAKLGELPPGVAIAVNDDPKAEMIDSVRVGLRFWRDQQRDESPDGFLVCPCDAVHVAADDVRRCLDRLADEPRSIVVATHDGKGGHPLVFSTTLVDAVHSDSCNAGLNQLARTRPDLVRRVECVSPGVLSNVNRPGDLPSA